MISIERLEARVRWLASRLRESFYSSDEADAAWGHTLQDGPGRKVSNFLIRFGCADASSLSFPNLANSSDSAAPSIGNHPCWVSTHSAR